MAFKWRWLERLQNRRACPRIALPLVAHYWDGSAPQGYPVKDISAKGAYILTSGRWYPGTIVKMTFASGPSSALVFRAKVVRFGADGVGVQFLYLSKQERKSSEKFMAEADARAKQGGYPEARN